MTAKPKLCQQSHTPESDYERKARLDLRRRDRNMRPGAVWPNRSKYMPHQGVRERVRRAFAILRAVSAA